MAKKKLIPAARSDADRRARQSDRIGRVWNVLQLILGRGRHDAGEIAHELGCSERTVYRDLNVLEMAGIPWYYDEAARSYRVRPGWQFPILKLTDDELLGQAAATVVANTPGLRIGQGAGATTRKLAATLSDEDKQRLDDAEQLISVLDLKLADHSRSQEAIRAIQWALLERRQLTGQYASPYQEKSVKLTLTPFRLCLVQQAWYLIARPANEDRPKTYRVQQFKTLRRVDTPADVPEDFDLKQYFGNAWGVYRGDESFDVELRFSKETAPFVLETTWHPTQQTNKHADGTVTMQFKVDGLEEMLWWLLGWSGGVRVIKPEKLRLMLVEELQKALTLNSKTSIKQRS